MVHSGHCLDALVEAEVGFLADGEPEDAVGEGVPHHLQLAQGLRQHRLADAAHALERRERDVAVRRFLKQRVAELGYDFGPVHEVGRHRRRIVVARLRRGRRARLAHGPQKLLEALAVLRVVAEVKAVASVEMEGYLAAALHPHWDHALALIERPGLLGTADVRGEGAVRQERDHYLGTVERGLDLIGPTVTGLQTEPVQPHIEATGLQIAFKAHGEFGAVAVGVRDEDAWAFGHRHRPSNHYVRCYSPGSRNFCGWPAAWVMASAAR